MGTRAAIPAAAALVAQVLLLGAVAGIAAATGVGLSTPAWIAGLVCGMAADTGLAVGVTHYRCERLTEADWVTLARATVVACVAALVVDSFAQPVPVALLVSLSAVALTLDAIDGWVARRTGSGPMGAHFDAEVDAFLILVLSVYVARFAGAWVLLIGAARYAFLVAGWVLPWMREPLPRRDWRKVVCATQGIVLTVVAAQVLPLAVERAALVVALGLLAESFGRDVLWLRRHRTRPVPKGISVALTVVAVLIVWAALVLPDNPVRVTPAAFLSVPLEGLLLIALAVVLPTTARRVMAWVAGPVLGVVLILKVLDIGFFIGFDRAFDPYQDVSYAGIGSETLRQSLGASDAHLVIAGAVALVVAFLVFTTLAVRRVTRVAAANRRWSFRVVAALGAVWLLSWAFGARLVPHTPVASTSAASEVVAQVSALRADLRDHSVFAREITQDHFVSTPPDRLLTGLRGKDVVLAFVESYGRGAIQGTSFSPGVNAVLNTGNQRLASAGFSARSAFLTSPTYGGISWLAHSTMQSGLWVNTPRRYDQIVASNRFTLSKAFKRAGWRTVDDLPSNERAWPQGNSFYKFDQVYDRRNVGYRGPTFAYASMPDQYVMSALQRLELAKRHRRPVFAEVDLVSSHTPWTRIPRMIPWGKVGDGSVFNELPVDETSKAALWSDSGRVRAAYGKSIQYTLNALTSFVQHYRDPNLVMVVLGDHQPSTIVSGLGASHEVPISVIARDPAVLKRISGWGWNAGLRPAPRAPVWPMSAFRDRFLGAFGS
jgi:hypothetical protein